MEGNSVTGGPAHVSIFSHVCVGMRDDSSKSSDEGTEPQLHGGWANGQRAVGQWLLPPKWRCALDTRTSVTVSFNLKSFHLELLEATTSDRLDSDSLAFKSFQNGSLLGQFSGTYLFLNLGSRYLFLSSPLD